MNNKSEITIDLKAKGHKVTKYRVALLDLLEKKERPLTVEEILEYLFAKKLSPNKTTIYRELYFLIEEKMVVEVEFGDGKKRYEHANRDHHHHLVCKKCNKIEDIVIENDLKEIEKKIKRSRKFNVINHTLEFFGLCQKCS
jgi:Fur family transcriptional regulator, ferric uptake regulator